MGISRYNINEEVSKTRVQRAMEVLEVPKEKYKVYEEKLKNTKDKKIDKGHL